MKNNLTTELSQLVQALYGGARRLAPDAFQDWALNQVKSIIPFDSGKWLTGTVHNEQAIVHNIYLHNQPPQMNRDYAKYQYQNRLLAELIKTRGEVKTYSMYDTRKVNISLHMNTSKSNQNAVSAICDIKGILREAKSSFFDMIIKQWPDWQPPVLPLEPQNLLGDKSEAEFHGKQIVIHMQPWGDLVYVTVRNKCAYDQLTPTEQQVARYLTHGLTNKEIALRLDISPKTVDNHLQHIYKKFGVCNRQKAVAAIGVVEFGGEDT